MPRDSAAGLLLVVLDGEGQRFGAYVNEALRPSKEYYGNGEWFVISLLINTSADGIVALHWLAFCGDPSAFPQATYELA